MHTAYCRLRLVFLLGLLPGLPGLLPFAVHAQDASAVVEGVVVDGRGEALPYASVQVVGTYDGAATNAQGRFLFATAATGPQQVKASMVGFASAMQPVLLQAGDTTTVRLVLKEILVSLDEAVVTASAYVTGEAEEATLQTLEVVTTPGAAADVFLAVKTLPGLAMVDEGAGLFVRGGDVNETVLLLDQATVLHPYKYESPTGGVFGTISPFMVAGTFFSSGGFSARYGNALSGILAMESLGMPQRRAVTVNAGLAAGSLGFDWPIVPDKLGLRFTGNRSFTGLLFRLNGQADTFTTTPRGFDGNLSLTYRYRPEGLLKLFHFVNSDRLGVRVDQPSFDGRYESESLSRMHNLQWTELFGSWVLRTSASWSRYRAERTLGNLDLEPADDVLKLRTDAEHRLSERVNLLVGAEAEHIANHFVGTVPQQDGVLNPNAAVYRFDERYGATRTGGYAELQLNPTRRIVATLGLRADHHSLASETTLDPRASLRFVLSQATDLRLAWGRYHQAPEPFLFNPTSGNPDLGAQQAQHLIVGFSHERGVWLIRAEAYHKPYRALVVADDAQGYVNAGEGRARGFDAFVKYGAFLRTRVNGWVSYSYGTSERTQARQVGTASVREDGPAPFDVTHNLTVVAKTRLFGFVSGGLTFRYATGRPVTPVVDAVPGDASASYYLPIEGPVGSERLPDFRRLDASLSYYLPMGDRNATFYLAVSNVTGFANVLEYTYNRDYTERSERRSTYRRFVYFGVSVTL